VSKHLPAVSEQGELEAQVGEYAREQIGSCEMRGNVLTIPTN
jgi:hypothetical protein